MYSFMDYLFRFKVSEIRVEMADRGVLSENLNDPGSASGVNML
jgi:hypothetical protein